MENLEGEIWADIPGYNGLYQASTFGRIMSFNGRSKSQKYKYEIGQLMTGSKRRDGYISVLLCNEKNKAVAKGVHRLVAITFLPNPENKEQVNHIDGNRSNNRLDNLEWVSRLENNHHGASRLKKTTSKYIGVSYNSLRQKWVSRIQINYKVMQLGYFDTEEEAYSALQKKIKELGLESKYYFHKKEGPSFDSPSVTQ